MTVSLLKNEVEHLVYDYILQIVQGVLFDPNHTKSVLVCRCKTISCVGVADIQKGDRILCDAFWPNDFVIDESTVYSIVHENWLTIIHAISGP